MLMSGEPTKHGVAQVRSAAAWLLCVALPCLVVAGPAPAQTKSAPAKEKRTKLSKEQLRERLEGKMPVIEKVMPEKYRKDPAKRRRWLQKFQVVQSDHYLLYTNGPTATCRKYAISLEDLYDFAKSQFEFDDVGYKLECYIFHQREEYYRFCVEVAGWDEKRARGTAGHANSRYYATYYTSPTDPVVMHEATHQIVGACLKVSGVGSWFQEGMAGYVEKKIGKLDPSSGMRNELKRGSYYPLTKFVGIKSLLFDEAGHGRRSYRHAGALIDFMRNTKLKPVAGKFEDFLDAARAGRGYGRGASVSERLVEEVYDLSLEELEALWKRHHRVR